MIKINISTKKRMRTTLFIVFLVITILIGRLGYIQLIDGKKLSELAYEQQTLDRAINPKRGTIYDSTGQVLAQSSTVETVTVNPGNIDENIKEKVAKKLSEIFGLDYEKILKKVSKRSSIETIAKNNANTLRYIPCIFWFSVFKFSISFFSSFIAPCITLVGRYGTIESSSAYFPLYGVVGSINLLNSIVAKCVCLFK